MSETTPPASSGTPKHRWATTTPKKLLHGPIVAGYIIVVLFFGGLGTWAALAHIASAAVATGVVSPDGSRKTVQHLEGGIISKILVKDGDTVAAGDPLVVLHETQARAAFQVLEGQRRLLTAKLTRLLSEQAGKKKVVFPDWLIEAKTDDAELGEMLKAQQDLFNARREVHNGRKAIGRKRKDELEEEITGLKSLIKSQHEQLRLLDEELAAKRKLIERGMLPRPEYLQLQRLKAEIEGETAENLSNVARAKQNIGETQLQIVNEDSRRLDEIISELTETRSELASVEERLFAQRDILERTVIAAPVSGVIVQSRFHTSGGVVGPGQPILDIVPQDTNFLIDAHVMPVDVDVVAPGQKARVHFLGLSERNLPQITGIVRSISADSLVDEISGQSYFLARVEVPQEELVKLGQDVKLTPGMPAEVLIVTGERTVFQYLVQPLHDSLRRSFTES